MNKIAIIGLGPGHPDYILPKAKKMIDNADIVIGGKRNLESIDVKGKETLAITSKLQEIIDFIKDNYLEKRIAVVVSGDTGFYSFLKYIRKHFKRDVLEVVPGISSLQYMFAKIGESWHDAYVGSLHGREDNLVELVKSYKKVGFLTDKKWNPREISKALLKEGIKERVIYVGENLSYDNEKIIRGSIEEISKTDNYEMCVVVIIHEE